MTKGILRGRSPIPTGVPDDKRLKPYKHLASSVIELAFHDAELKTCSAAESMAARRFLSGDTWLLQLWCRWLDIHPDRIRAAAGRRGWSEGVGRSLEDRA